MSTPCIHFDFLGKLTPNPAAGEECLKAGEHGLTRRTYLTGSPGRRLLEKRHATRHFHTARHPITPSSEYRADRYGCYSDNLMRGRNIR